MEIFGFISPELTMPTLHIYTTKYLIKYQWLCPLPLGRVGNGCLYHQYLVEKNVYHKVQHVLLGHFLHYYFLSEHF